MNKTILAAGLSAIVLGGCASMSALQSGRTLEQGEVTVVGAGGFTGVRIESDDPTEEDINAIWPNVETMVRLGVLPSLDVGIKWFASGALADAKYQFYGRDPKSDVALSAGFGFDYSSADIGWYDVYLPLFASYDPSPSLSLYASPRYVLRAAGSFGNQNLVGAVAGLGLGTSHRVFIEAGYLTDVGVGFLDGPTFQGTIGLTVLTKKVLKLDDES
ncbi:MAG: hypothetical protein HYY13_13600 [Nitrospirae bacterium]|nr:hypothetical protein [Nitrospirota bacterium]